MALPVLAGPNAGGTILAHNAQLLTSGTDGSVSVCGQGTVPATCDQVVAEIDGAGSADPAIFKVYAAFPDGSSPRLKGVTWGVHYPETIVVAAQGMCGDFELNDTTWPATDTGSSVTWNEVQTSLLIPVYWFAAYQYDAGLFGLIANPSPTLGGYFGDDAIPAHLDPIAGYGSMGFSTPGVAVCPPGQPGACCDLDTGLCTMELQPDCIGTRQVFMGAAINCNTNPCPTSGACCEITEGHQSVCEVLSSDDCAAAGGVFRGVGVACGGDVCLGYGACCNGATCTLTLAADCAGIFLDVNAPCSPNPCGAAYGACCNDLSCTVTTQEACVDHIWLSGSDCQPNNPCEIQLGACCEGTTCSIQTAAECPGNENGHGAIWAGNVPCTTTGGSTCSQTLGACCTGNPPGAQQCSITTQADCLPNVWLLGYDCRDDICATPVEHMTWGRIKSTYGSK